jgi:hypothetical protein
VVEARQGAKKKQSSTGRANHTGVQWGTGTDPDLPSSKRFPTPSPAATKRFLFGMCSLMPLDMFHTPNMESQCKLICRSGGRREEARSFIFSLHSPEAFAAILARQRLGLLVPALPILIGRMRRSRSLDGLLEAHHGNG